MRKRTVIFRKVEDMLDFVKKVENYPYNMDMKSGRFTVDAKSLFGLLNLGLERKIELKVYDLLISAVNKRKPHRSHSKC